MYMYLFIYITDDIYIHYGQGLKPKSVLDLRPNYCTRSENIRRKERMREQEKGKDKRTHRCEIPVK